jgi:hypothetical protein
MRRGSRSSSGTPSDPTSTDGIPSVDLALWDVVGTVLLAVLVARLTDASAVAVFVVLLAVATALHRLFCVPTRLVDALFP